MKSLAYTKGENHKRVGKHIHYQCLTDTIRITMGKDVKLKLTVDELKKIRQEKIDIIEKELSLIEETFKDLEKNLDAIGIPQLITLFEEEQRITKELKGLLNELLESDC